LSTRHHIGIAQGLLMAHFDIAADTAFQVLRRISSHHNIKLREVALTVIDYRGRMNELPWFERGQLPPLNNGPRQTADAAHRDDRARPAT
jgi:hypothetical protein